MARNVMSFCTAQVSGVYTLLLIQFNAIQFELDELRGFLRGLARAHLPPSDSFPEGVPNLVSQKSGCLQLE